MAEEDYNSIDSTNSDDVSVLRILLHSIRGISPVSTTDFVMIPIEDSETDVSS
jgi:hypothetical protein